MGINLGAAASSFSRSVSSTVSNASRSVSSAVSTASRSFSGSVSSASRSVSSSFSNASRSANNAVSSASRSFRSSFSNASRNFSSSFNSFSSRASSSLSSASRSFGSSFSNASRNVRSSLSSASRSFGSSVNRFGSSLSSTSRSLSSSFNRLGSSLSSTSRGLTNSFGSSFNRLGSSYNSFSRGTSNLFSSTLRNTGSTLNRLGSSFSSTLSSLPGRYNNLMRESYSDALALRQSSNPFMRAVGSYSVGVRNGISNLNRTVDEAGQFWRGVGGPVGTVGRGLVALGQGFTSPLRAVDHRATDAQRNGALIETGIMLATGALGKVAGPVLKTLGRTPLGQAATRTLGRLGQTQLGRQLARLPQVASWLNNAPGRALLNSNAGRQFLAREATVRNSLRLINNFGSTPVRVRITPPGMNTGNTTRPRSLPGVQPRALPSGQRGGQLVTMRDAVNPYQYLGRGRAQYGFDSDLPINVRVEGIRNAILDARMGVNLRTGNLGRFGAQDWAGTYGRSATLHVNPNNNPSLPWNWSTDANYAFVDTLGDLARQGKIDLIHIRNPYMPDGKGIGSQGTITYNELKQLTRKLGATIRGDNGFIYLIRPTR